METIEQIDLFTLAAPQKPLDFGVWVMFDTDLLYLLIVCYFLPRSRFPVPHSCRFCGVFVDPTKTAVFGRKQTNTCVWEEEEKGVKTKR